MVMNISLLGFVTSLLTLAPSITLAVPLSFEGPDGSSLTFYKQETPGPPDNFVKEDWIEAGNCVNSGLIHMMPLFGDKKPTKMDFVTNWIGGQLGAALEPLHRYDPVGGGEQKWYDVTPGEAPQADAVFTVSIKLYDDDGQYDTMIAEWKHC